MVYIGFPARFQSATLAVTNLFIQSRINILGTDAVAALAAFSKFLSIIVRNLVREKSLKTIMLR